MSWRIEKIVFPLSGVFILVVVYEACVSGWIEVKGRFYFLPFIKLSIQMRCVRTRTDSFRRQECDKCLSFERPYILKEQKTFIHSV
jgi:hypothetical protein